MPTRKKRILITGASGRIGQVLTTAWAEKYQLHLMDIRRPSYPLIGADFSLFSVTDIDQMRIHSRQADMIVHLAISGNQPDDWDQVSSVNLHGTWSVYQAASEAGVARVVYASSVMIDFAPQDPYGASKHWGEILASQYVKNTPLSILCLRLGAVAGPRDPRIVIGSKHLSHILTHHDLVRLFTAGVEASGSIRYGIFYGISANQPARFDIVNTRKVLGYYPQDDAFRLARRNLFTPKGMYNMTISLIKKAGRMVKKIWN